MDNGSRIIVETAVAGVTFGSLIDALPSFVALFALIYYICMIVEVIGRMRRRWNKD